MIPLTMPLCRVLAATLFTLLLAASNLLITYMQFLGGKGYDWRGLTGSIVTDASVSMAACLALAWCFFAGKPHHNPR